MMAGGMCVLLASCTNSPASMAEALRIPAGNPGVRGLRQTAEFGTATGAETEGGDPRNEGTTDGGTPENLQINFPEILG